MNYAEMSDGELNVAVAKAAYPECVFFVYGLGDAVECIVSHSVLDNRNFSPCNSWADAGPIIEREFIAINPVMKGWCASSSDDAEVYFPHENPLRAAMITYLMMRDLGDGEK